MLGALEKLYAFSSGLDLEAQGRGDRVIRPVFPKGDCT